MGFSVHQIYTKWNTTSVFTWMPQSMFWNVYGFYFFYGGLNGIFLTTFSKHIKSVEKIVIRLVGKISTSVHGTATVDITYKIRNIPTCRQRETQWLLHTRWWMSHIFRTTIHGWHKKKHSGRKENDHSSNSNITGNGRNDKTSCLFE